MEEVQDREKEQELTRQRGLPGVLAAHLEHDYIMAMAKVGI